MSNIFILFQDRTVLLFSVLLVVVAHEIGIYYVQRKESDSDFPKIINHWDI